jgi:pimeloyl-ACP methyl ester carboxylesterase
MTVSRQLVLLPGLGADGRLFEPQRRAFPDLLVPPWLPPGPREPLADYAVRMAEVIRPLCPGPFVIGGVSFGGIAAYEIARHLSPDAVVLVASCRQRRGLRRVYRAGRWVWPAVPVAVWQSVKRLAVPVSKLIGETEPGERAKLVRMFQEQDSRFMHWTVWAVITWNPAPLPGVPVFHIHGRRDRLIPAWRVAPDEWILDGGHMINVTHPEVVNAFIRRAMDGCRRDC